MSKGNVLPLPADAPKAGEVYRHYKGDQYKVVGMALDSGDAGEGVDRWLVVYEPLYDNPAAPLFARPFVEWRQVVEWQGAKTERFIKVV